MAAGRRNQLKRGPLAPEGREKLRLTALQNQPWLQSTGPRTAEGERRSADNGRKNQVGDKSVRAMRAELADMLAMMKNMQELRRTALRSR